MQTYTPAALPDNEERRLDVLGDYALLDSPSDVLFDVLTRLAAQLCDVPISLITLVDRDRQWFKSNVGLETITQTTRDVAFCAHTILTDDIIEIADMSLDPRFARNPLVASPPNVRFYAGVPLTVSGGLSLGALCVMDRSPRTLTEEQRAALRAIATEIVREFEARRERLRANDRTQPAIALGEARLLELARVERNLFQAVERRELVETLVTGVADVMDGATAHVLARGTDAEFIATDDLLSKAEIAIASDDFVRAAAVHEGVLLSDDARRAGVPIAAATGAIAYVLDVRAAGMLAFTAADSLMFALLGESLAGAIRNVELQAELASRRAAVVELNQVKNDLIAMLAHDFKGPLTTIVGLADVLAEDQRFDAESRQFLGMINSSAMRLASLASDTLALSRLEQNELSLRFDRVDLVSLLRDIVRVFTVTRGIDMRSAAETLIVRADAARLRQVFENLIGNAIKYSPGGETVDVILREKNGGVEVAIRDRGIGIPPADLSKLFGRFARGSNARELGIGGTGFGLYLSRTIIEMHGGHITIESKEGSGSTFRAFVPTVPAPQPTLDRRVLLLDRDEDGHAFIARTLRNEGYAVFPVASEAELLIALDATRYDAAIVDVDCLVMSGAELVERIGHRTTLVRLVSAVESESTGWDAALSKPFLMKDLQVILESAVAERRRSPRRATFIDLEHG